MVSPWRRGGRLDGIPWDTLPPVDEPRRLLPDIVAAGPAVVTVHAEATRHLHRTLQVLTALGAARDHQPLRGSRSARARPCRRSNPCVNSLISSWHPAASLPNPVTS